MTLLFIESSATGAEAARKDFLEPDDAIDPIEDADTSTALKQTATMVLTSVALQNGLENNTKLRRLLSHPAGASNVSPEMMPQQSSVDDHASDQSGSEHSRSTAEDADQAAPPKPRDLSHNIAARQHTRYTHRYSHREGASGLDPRLIQAAVDHKSSRPPRI